MNMMQGEFFLAVANKSLTLDAPTPTNISINSAAEIEMKGTPASPATAFAREFCPFLEAQSKAHLWVSLLRFVYIYLETLRNQQSQLIPILLHQLLQHLRISPQ